MRRTGRAHWTVVALVGLAALAAVLLLVRTDSPQAAADRFLTALAKGDAKTLAEMSFFDPARDAARVEADWRKTLDRGEYFRFVWRQKATNLLPGDRATVAIQFVRDAGTRYAYEENFSLDLLRRDGRWKVDVLGLSREMYPALPR